MPVITGEKTLITLRVHFFNFQPEQAREKIIISSCSLEGERQRRERNDFYFHFALPKFGVGKNSHTHTHTYKLKEEEEAIISDGVFYSLGERGETKRKGKIFRTDKDLFLILRSPEVDHCQLTMDDVSWRNDRDEIVFFKPLNVIL